MKKIISFSLWGTNPKYLVGAIKNIELSKIYYPGWICRFYVGKSVPKYYIEEMQKHKNTEIVFMNDEGDLSGMLWRFLPASDEDVEMMISRDCDSRLNKREESAVKEWVNSEKSFHIMRDHPNHGIKILGGMWGVKNPTLKGMKKWISIYEKGNYYQVDQNFLLKFVYPIIENDCIIHDEFFEKKKFPNPREGKQFVGEPFDEFDNPDDYYRSLIV